MSDIDDALEMLREQIGQLEADRDFWRRHARALYLRVRVLADDPIDPQSVSDEDIARDLETPPMIKSALNAEDHERIQRLLADRSDEPRHVRFDDTKYVDECVFGERCCCPHLFHSPSECFTAEWADDYFGDADADIEALPPTPLSPVEEGLAELRDAPAVSRTPTVLVDFTMPEHEG